MALEVFNFDDLAGRVFGAMLRSRQPALLVSVAEQMLGKRVSYDGASGQYFTRDWTEVVDWDEVARLHSARFLPIREDQLCGGVLLSLEEFRAGAKDGALTATSGYGHPARYGDQGLEVASIDITTEHILASGAIEHWPPAATHITWYSYYRLIDSAGV